MSSTEPRRYIKRDRPRSIATTDAKHITAVQNQTSASTSNLPDITKVLSPIEKKVKILTPKKENESNGIQNGDEWTEISLNNSPEEIYYNNDAYFDEEENEIPYKPLGTDLSPELSNITGDDNVKHKKLVTQKSLPAMTEKNEISLTEEKKAQVTRSPSFKRKGKLDSCLATWISRNSVAGEMSVGSSGKQLDFARAHTHTHTHFIYERLFLLKSLKISVLHSQLFFYFSANSSRRQSLDMLWNSGTGERVKELLNQGMMMLNISNLTERRPSEPKVVDNEKDKDKVEKTEKAELKGKKVPSPLEKTMNYLNAEEETSDSESLAR